MVRVAVLALALFGTLISQTLAQTCYSTERNPYRNYGSLSLYPKPQSSGIDRTPGCQPTMVFTLIKNAIRTPTDDELRVLQDRLPALRNLILNSQSSQLCQDDLNALQNWRQLVTPNATDLLTQRGQDDIRELAARMRNRLPQLMNRQYSDDEFLIRHSYRTDRANSATAFAEGLGFNASVAFGPSQIERDLLLQFSENCKSDDNDFDDDDLEDFLEDPAVQQMVEGITTRLGLQPNSLSFDDIDAMYKMCAYDYALFNPQLNDPQAEQKVRAASPWCAAFIRDDLMLLELKEDLISSELYGYGDDINMKETCILLKDFVGRLNDRQLQASQLPAVVTYFAKTETLLPFLTSLELFEDEEELEFDDGDLASMANRKWKTSFISPFMANIAVTMYECQGQNGLPTYSIKVAVNEVPVQLPECSTTVCPISDLMGMIEDFAETCSYEELCDGVSATSSSIAVLAFMALISTLYACLFS